jgi:hypothetical protein
MPITAVVTGKTGAGLTMTATSFSDIASFEFNSISKMLTLTDLSGHITQISVAAAATFTWTLVGSVYTVTIS